MHRLAKESAPYGTGTSSAMSLQELMAKSYLRWALLPTNDELYQDIRRELIRRHAEYVELFVETRAEFRHTLRGCWLTRVETQHGG